MGLPDVYIGHDFKSPLNKLTKFLFSF